MVAGTWRVERKKTRAALLVQPFGALTKKVKEEIEAEGEGLVRFLESDARDVEVKLAKA